MISVITVFVFIYITFVAKGSSISLFKTDIKNF